MVQRSLPHQSVLAATVLTYGAGLLCLLAQFFPNVSLFEMATSFLPLISLASIAVTLALFRYHARIAVAGVVFVGWAALPFLSFPKYTTPSHSACEPNTCLTVIVANVYQLDPALVRLAELSEAHNPDLIAVIEPPASANPETYREHFPEHDQIVHVDRRPGANGASIPLSLLSRQGFASADSDIPDRTGLRALIKADLKGKWSGVRIVTAHPHVPLTAPGLHARNRLLSVAGDTAEESEAFILMGDFNLTPWSPTFRALPGKRAGDPRFVQTWPVAWGPLGIPIDHIMISENLELVEARLLPHTGSDHRAILARFRPKARE